VLYAKRCVYEWVVAERTLTLIRTTVDSNEKDRSSRKPLNRQMFPHEHFALFVEDTAAVLANQAHHTTADATLESTLLTKPMVFLDALTSGYTAVIVLMLAGGGLVRHAIHAGCHVPHIASFRL
jgi:hypothetical protein